MAIFQINKTKNDDLISSLENILGKENVLSEYEERYCYSVDATAINTKKCIPDVVVLPENKEQILQITKLANKLNIPIIQEVLELIILALVLVQMAEL